MDFTFNQYLLLLKTLKSQGFLFCTLSNYFSSNSIQQPIIVLRHDVEARYENALQIAQIQHELGIRGSYYFRLLPKSYNETIIKQIASLGHEIGYHYDDLSHCKGNYENAIERFIANLDHLREVAPVTSITMEGAPLSRYDNRDLWKKYNYRKYCIIAEPYFDLNFNEIFYLTDTGRRWDGDKFNVRDKPLKMSGERDRGELVSDERHRYQNIGDGGNETVNGNYLVGSSKDGVTNPEFLKLRFRHTSDIIKAVNEGTFPKQAMLNFHPQRWNDAFIPWVRELVWQNTKNQVKRFLVKR